MLPCWVPKWLSAGTRRPPPSCRIIPAGLSPGRLSQERKGLLQQALSHPERFTLDLGCTVRQAIQRRANAGTLRPVAFLGEPSFALLAGSGTLKTILDSRRACCTSAVCQTKQLMRVLAATPGDRQAQVASITPSKRAR